MISKGMSRRRCAYRFSGFTLIEILVVISIIAILIGILLPALGSVRNSAQMMACMSNQRQLSAAMLSYVSDNKDYFPQPARDKDYPGSEKSRTKVIWFNAVDKYFDVSSKKDYSNSASRNYESYKQDPVWESFSADERDGNRTIKMNEEFGNISTTYDTTPRTWRAIRVHEVHKPALTVLLFDGRAMDTPSVTTGNTGGSSKFSGYEVYVGLRHRGGANVIFTDGHVEHVVQPIRETSSGYQGWYAGEDHPNTSMQGQQQLLWRFKN